VAAADVVAVELVGFVGVSVDVALETLTCAVMTYALREEKFQKKKGTIA